MSLTDNNNGMIMPVSPMYGNGGMGGFGYGGDGLFFRQQSPATSSRILTAVLSRRLAVDAA